MYYRLKKKKKNLKKSTATTISHVDMRRRPRHVYLSNDRNSRKMCPSTVFRLHAMQSINDLKTTAKPKPTELVRVGLDKSVNNLAQTAATTAVILMVIIIAAYRRHHSRP